MGLLDGLPATNRKEPDRLEASPPGKVPIDRLAEIAPACRISRARVVDAGRIVTAGGITSGMEMGFHLLRRAGYDEKFIADVARVMEYTAAYEMYREDRESLDNGPVQLDIPEELRRAVAYDLGARRAERWLAALPS